MVTAVPHPLQSVFALVLLLRAHTALPGSTRLVQFRPVSPCFAMFRHVSPCFAMFRQQHTDFRRCAIDSRPKSLCLGFLQLASTRLSMLRRSAGGRCGRCASASASEGRGGNETVISPKKTVQFRAEVSSNTAVGGDRVVLKGGLPFPKAWIPYDICFCLRVTHSTAQYFEHVLLFYVLALLRHRSACPSIAIEHKFRFCAYSHDNYFLRHLTASN